VEHHRVALTCFIWPGKELPRKEVVACPVGNESSSLLLNIPQKQMAQLVGH
jgi:hypothetical protein